MRRPASRCAKAAIVVHLLRVEFDNELLLHGHGEVFTNRQTLNHAFEVVFFKVEPLRNAAPNHRIQGILDQLDLAAALAHLDGISDEEIEWLFETADVGTPVFIHE